MYKLLITIALSLFYSYVYAWDPNDRIPLDPRYKLELEDRHHRPNNILKPIYSIWEKSWKYFYPVFWDFIDDSRDYLEPKHPTLYDPNYFLVWLDKSERKEYELTFHQNGNREIQAFSPREGVLKDGKWMYVQKGHHFYTAMEIKYRLHHISLCAGEPVNCAGTFTIRDGRVTTFSTISGHYRPDVKQGQDFLEALHDIFNLNLSGLRMTFWDTINGHLMKSTIRIEDFMRLNPYKIRKESKHPYFKAFTDLEEIEDEKVKLFLDTDGTIYIGSSELDSEDPLCLSAGPFIGQATAKLQDRQIHKLMFKAPIQNLTQIEEIKFFVNTLSAYGIEAKETKIVIIQNNEKVELSINQLLGL